MCTTNAPPVLETADTVNPGCAIFKTTAIKEATWVHFSIVYSVIDSHTLLYTNGEFEEQVKFTTTVPVEFGNQRLGSWADYAGTPTRNLHENLTGVSERGNKLEAMLAGMAVQNEAMAAQLTSLTAKLTPDAGNDDSGGGRGGKRPMMDRMRCEHDRRLCAERRCKWQ